MRLVCFAMALMLTPAVSQACDLAPVQIVHGEGKVGDVTMNFGEADDAQHPTAWQGPLQISVGSAPACTVSDDVSIIEGPVMFGEGVLYVPTYSGSNNRLYAVDAKTCKVLWRSSDFSGKTSFKKGKLVIGAKQVSMDKRCQPPVSGGK